MKPHHHVAAASAELPNTRQRLYMRYYAAVTADLVVLGLMSQFWDKVSIDSFSTGLIAAALLQILLQGTLMVEHAAAGYFANKTGLFWQGLRWFTAWFILFSSKFVMLWVIGLVLGERIQFHGALHGAAAFIVVVIAMVLTEELLFRSYRAMESTPTN